MDVTVQDAAGTHLAGTSSVFLSTSETFSEPTIKCLGEPYFEGKVLTPVQLIQLYQDKGLQSLHELTGHFACVLSDPTTKRHIAMTDKFATANLYYHFDNNTLVVSSSLAELKRNIGEVKLSNQSLFHYVYFHCIPSPNTIYQDVYKLEPGHMLLLENGALRKLRYWTPEFCNNNDVVDQQALQAELRQALSDATSPYANQDDTGAFLSGGLDSSSVVAFLAGNSQKPVNTFTIGFSEPGYDEKAFAKAVAEQFGTKHHEYDVTPEDIFHYLPEIARFYDEPFGNSSALPTFFCAKFAKQQGITTLLAGDGGDELFAGNERYAKQKVFEKYVAQPALVKGVLNNTVLPLAKLLPINIFKKAQSYLYQANIGLPARLQHYNFLHQVAPGDVFESAFLSGIDASLPESQWLERYQEVPDAHFVDRMLYLDWKFTLADNDLMKVNYMTQMAGVNVHYPMLDEKLVSLCTRVPADIKLPGDALRDFYKKAMAEVLPASTLNKSKHGFGLPFGNWLVKDADLQKLAKDTLDQLGNRSIFQPAFIERAQRMQQDVHAAYYGELVWIMIMLELWLQSHE